MKTWKERKTLKGFKFILILSSGWLFFKLSVSVTLTQNPRVRSTNIYKIPQNTIVMSICWMQLSKVRIEGSNCARPYPCHGNDKSRSQWQYYFISMKQRGSEPVILYLLWKVLLYSYEMTFISSCNPSHNFPLKKK